MTETFIGRGTTPGISFTFPFAQEDVVAVYINIYGTASGAMVEKTLDDIMFGERDGKPVISIILTQEDTLLFSDRDQLEMQIKAKLTNGVVPYSPIVRTTIGAVLKGEVI